MDQNKKHITIAIDGPAAAGKSTIAKRIAEILNISYIDTGSMYRAVTLYMLENNIDIQNEELCSKELSKIKLEIFPNSQILCNGKDVSKEIRLPLVTQNVSKVASYKKVREFLVSQQQEMARNTSVIMDGRDIGTHVLPNADIKIFQIASVEARAKRRYLENISKNIPCSYDEIKTDIEKRDYEDMNRTISPLVPAKDSIELDTSALSIEEVINKILSYIYNYR